MPTTSTTGTRGGVKGFFRRGSRFRLGQVAFLPEDAAFVIEEAMRRDCSAADVVREAVRELRFRAEKQPS